MNLELKLYLIVMSIFCTPLFFWMVVTRNNQYRQRVFGEDPRDQVGCQQMIVVSLVRILLAGAPPLIAGLFIAMWAEDPPATSCSACSACTWSSCRRGPEGLEQVQRLLSGRCAVWLRRRGAFPEPLSEEAWSVRPDGGG
jgi:hypothetical protein